MLGKTMDYLSGQPQEVLARCVTVRTSSPKTEALVAALRRAFDAGQEVDLSTCSDPAVVMGLLKTYLNGLRSPLLTDELYEGFVNAAREGDYGTKVRRTLALALVLDLTCT
jgi:hypothetical protein